MLEALLVVGVDGEGLAGDVFEGREVTVLWTSCDVDVVEKRDVCAGFEMVICDETAAGVEGVEDDAVFAAELATVEMVRFGFCPGKVSFGSASPRAAHISISSSRSCWGTEKSVTFDAFAAHSKQLKYPISKLD